VLVTVGHLLVCEPAADRVAEQEHPHLDTVTPGELPGQAEPVVGALGPVGRVVQEHEDLHRGLLVVEVLPAG
jgi:hypothetical protein